MGTALVVILSLLLTLFLLLRDPFTQSFLARVATTYLSDKLNTEIKIDRVTVSAFFSILIKDIEINDLHQNNILSAKEIKITTNKVSLKKHLLHVEQIKLNHANIDLVTYQEEENMNFQFLIDYFSSKNLNDSIVIDTTKVNWLITFDKIELTSSSFKIVNENKPKTPQGMDYDRIVVNDINLEIEKLDLQNDTVLFDIKKLNCSEQSGFALDQFSGEFSMANTFLGAQNLKIKTAHSDLDLDFKFTYKDFNAYSNFIEEVMIQTDIRRSTLNLADIGFFAPELFVMDNKIIIENTSVKGTVENFRAQKLNFKFGKSTMFNGQLSMKGLPNIEQTYCDLKITELHTSAKDLSSFALPIESVFLNFPEELHAFGECSMIGYMKGIYNDFNSNFVLKSEIGNLATEINLNTLDSTGTTFYNGRIQSLKFDLGKMFKISDLLGSMNLDLGFNGSGLSLEEAVVKLNGEISALELKQNNYNQVKINAELADNKFDGHLEVLDEDIDFQFDGSVDFNKDIPEFNFSSDIKQAHLFNINLLKHDSTAILSTKLNINYAGIKLDDMEGVIKISNTIYQQNNKIYKLDDLEVNAYYDTAHSKIIELKSDYIDADVKGDFLFNELYASITGLVGQYVPVLFNDSSIDESKNLNQKLDFEINLKNTDALTELLYPRLNIAPDSRIAGYFYTDQNAVYLEANSTKVEFSGIKFYDWYLKTNNDENAFLILTGSKDLAFKAPSEDDTTAIGLENFNVLAAIQNDSIDYRIAWDDFESFNYNVGYLAGYLKLQSKTESEMKLKKADFMINNEAWNIDLNSHVYIDKALFSIDSLHIFSKNQSLLVTGVASGRAEDTLDIVFENWDLSNFDLVINDPNLNIDGILDGNVQLMDMYNSPKATAQLEIEKLALNEQYLGRGEFRSVWDNSENALNAAFDIIHIGNSSESKVFGISGIYLPQAIDHNLDFNIDISNFNLSVFSPFLSEFMSEVEGFASGKLLLDGTLEKPRIIGNLNLMRTGLKIDYTNVKYSLANEVKFRENEISFDQIVLYDTLGNQAVCQGRITHKYFNDFIFDINIKPENILGINTNKYQNSMFYGTAMASGDVRIYGPIDEMVIDITARSEEGTEIFIPISYDLEVSETDYIVFVNSNDTVNKPVDYNVDLSGLSLNLDLSVSPNADIELYLPYGMGNIKADGSGDIKIGVNSRGDFEILGDYFINQGTFLFTLQNLVNRKFSILEGGKISWTGSPYEAEINIKTLYKTKASLNGFGIESDRRYNIDCYLDLSQQLLDPAIHFSIGIPNIDSDDEQKVFAQLDVNNEAQMNQQMISLLVLGSFSSSSNETPSAGSIGASSLNVISNQLSSWLSQMSKDFDVGINYRPSGEYTQEELEVALSTQLFNNRVLIDGNISRVSGSSSTSNTTNIVGDVNVEYKITDDGKFRIKAFNRSNINNSAINDLDERSPYTQGVGVFYRKEFDSFGDLFKNTKSKKKKKDEENIKGKP